MPRILVLLTVLSGCAPGEIAGGPRRPMIDGGNNPQSNDSMPTQQDGGPASAPDSLNAASDSFVAPDLTVAPDVQPPPPKRLGIGGIVGGSYQVSQPYGPTSFWMDYSYCKSYGNWPAGQNVHCAVDISIPRGTPLYAAEDATVVTAGGTLYFKDDQNPAAGELRIRLKDGTHVIYGHSSKITVTKGAKVKIGQLIGESGTAGTGAHLHLEVRVPDSSFQSGFRTVDPMQFFGP